MKSYQEESMESKINRFADKHGWEVFPGMRGSTGAYWIKDGRYRMVSLEPKKYGWLVGISNQLFRDGEDIKTCELELPLGKHRYDKYKLTKNFWAVTTEDLSGFLSQ